MRAGCLACVVVLPFAAIADDQIIANPSNETEFQLGGASERAAKIAILPEAQPEAVLPAIRFPRSMFNETEMSFGLATVFQNHERKANRDAVRFGTFLERGQARAGFSVTVHADEDAFDQPQVFIDYSINQTLNIGVSGRLDNDLEDEGDDQFGFNAGLSTLGGNASLQGSVAGIENPSSPVFGLSFGLRF